VLYAWHPLRSNPQGAAREVPTPGKTVCLAPSEAAERKPPRHRRRGKLADARAVLPALTARPPPWRTGKASFSRMTSSWSPADEKTSIQAPAWMSTMPGSWPRRTRNGIETGFGTLPARRDLTYSCSYCETLGLFARV